MRDMPQCQLLTHTPFQISNPYVWLMMLVGTTIIGNIAAKKQ